MKKIFTILFALCLVAALSLSISAESTNKLTYTVGASASTVSANTEFTVLVKITENTGVCFVKAVVKYDSSVLTYVSGSKDTTAFTGATLDINNPRKGEVILSLGGISAFISPNPTVYSQTGEFVSLKFKVNEDAAVGKTTISVATDIGDVVITKDSKPNYDFEIKNESVSVSVINGSAHVCEPGTATRDNEIAPTCTEDGSYETVVKCTICNADITRNKITVPKLGHKPSEAVKENDLAPSCIVDGSYDNVVYCTVCNVEISRNHIIVPKLGHKPGTEVKENVVPATCISVGKYDSVIRCTVCNTVSSKTTVVIPINEEHKPGTAVKENEKAGDCMTASSYESVVYCTVCSKEISRKTVTGAKGNHVAGVPEVNYVESTCTKKGSITEISKCSLCNTVLDKKVTELDLVDHISSAPVKENVIEATCMKSGSYLSVVKCAVCSARLSSEVVQVDRLAHSPAAAVEENRKEPVNCGANGSYDSVVYCTLCKAELSRISQSIKAPDHTPGPAATETTPQICTVCNVVLEPAHGHTHHWGSAFVGDSTGHWIACSGCSEKKDFSAHKYDNNCDATCNDCGTQRIPGDHVFGPWATIKEATTSAEGQRERKCNVCGYTETDVIPKKAEETTVAPPVTTNPPETTKEPEATIQPPETTQEPEITTAPETTEEPAVTTAPETTETPAATTKPEDTTEQKKENGCKSAISVGVAFIAILGSAIILKKRD